MTVREIAKRLQSVSQTPLLDARRLMQAADSQECLKEYIERRLKHEPVSKITGSKGFWKYDFIVTTDVLDPRPDTEVLIEAVLRYYPQYDSPFHFLDIGTGSGCLLRSLLGEYPNAMGVGIDISDSALKIAEKNVHDVCDRAELYQDDFYKNDFGRHLGQFDFIVSNPPYIKTKDIDSLSQDVRQYDPLGALDGGFDGLDAYRALAKKVGSLLKNQGLVFFEIGIGQSDDVKQIMCEEHFDFLDCCLDLGGIERVLIFKKSF